MVFLCVFRELRYEVIVCVFRELRYEVIVCVFRELRYEVILCVFRELRYEVIVYFVNIDGIVNHHYLNFLFITVIQHYYQ